MATKTEFNNNFEFAVHPGRILKEYLTAIGLKQKDLSQQTGLSKTVISEIIHGKRNISLSYALKFEPIFEMPASYWTKLQLMYEEAIARLNNKEFTLKTEQKNEYNIESDCFEIQARLKIISQAA